MYKLLARMVCLAHLCFVICVTLGLFAAYFFPGLRSTHLGIVSSALISWPIFRGCPFTTLEKRLLEKHSIRAYDGPCITHYSERFGVSIPDRFVQIFMICILAASITQYLMIL